MIFLIYVLLILLLGLSFYVSEGYEWGFLLYWFFAAFAINIDRFRRKDSNTRLNGYIFLLSIVITLYIFQFVPHDENGFLSFIANDSDYFNYFLDTVWIIILIDTIISIILDAKRSKNLEEDSSGITFVVNTRKRYKHKCFESRNRRIKKNDKWKK